MRKGIPLSAFLRKLHPSYRTAIDHLLYQITHFLKVEFRKPEGVPSFDESLKLRGIMAIRENLLKEIEDLCFKGSGRSFIYPRITEIESLKKHTKEQIELMDNLIKLYLKNKLKDALSEEKKEHEKNDS